MSSPLNAIGSTVTKTFGMADNTIDMLNVFTIIGKEASEQILFETRIDNLKELKQITKDSGLSEDELAILREI